MNKLIFPKDFWWGAAMSGAQTESSKGRSMQIMDKFYELAPYRFFDGKNVEGNLENRLEDYIGAAKSLGLNSLRTSIQWSRLIPDGKSVSLEAVDFYRTYFNGLKSAGIKPFVTLFHFDTPMWAMDQGGWESKWIIEQFAFYAKTAFELFGDLVEQWFTMNEPSVFYENGYLYDTHYPNKVDMKAAMQVQFNLILAHAHAVKIFKDMKCNGEIGIVLNITPAIPRSSNPADVKAAWWAELFQSRTFLDSVTKGKFPIELIEEATKRGYLWEYTKSELTFIANAPKLDLIGINFYLPQRVKAVDFEPNWKHGAITPHYYYTDYVMPGRQMNPYRGWEIFPEAIYHAIKNIQNNYQNIKTYISENGMGVENEERFRVNGEIVDDYRIKFYKEHLAFVHKAIQEGANCVGFHPWTLVDNWSFYNAYKNRYGFFEFDLATKHIKEKKSAKWYRELIKANNDAHN